jgi:enamine deaminase RidA (YjgF/YER057c/UK114 family)
LIHCAPIATTALLLISCPTGAQPAATPTPGAARELIKPPWDPNYVAASRFGDLVFTAGHLGLADGTDFKADVEDALDRVEQTLEASGAGFDTLLKVKVYLTDWDNWETMNTTLDGRIARYGQPPRTTVEVSRLGLDAPVEIAVIAHVRASAP